MQKKVLAVRLNAIFDCNIVLVGISWCTSDCTLMAALAFGRILTRNSLSLKANQRATQNKYTHSARCVVVDYEH